jgi:hypothetical protein
LRLRTERAQQKMIRALIRGLRAYQHSDWILLSQVCFEQIPLTPLDFMINRVRF